MRKGITAMILGLSVLMLTLGISGGAVGTTSHEVFMFCYDQNTFTDNIKKKLKARKLLIEVLRLPAFKAHKFKSSKLK